MLEPIIIEESDEDQTCEDVQCVEVDPGTGSLRMSTKNMPDVPQEGFIVRTHYAGISQADVHYLDKCTEEKDGDEITGFQFGKEIAGTIAAIGIDVPPESHLVIGDYVMVYPFQGCFQCEQCYSEDSQLCDIINQPQDSTTWFSTHVAISHWTFGIKIPVDMPEDIACMVPTAALTAYSALHSAAPALEHALYMRTTARLLIIGADIVGMWCTILAKEIFDAPNMLIMCVDENQDNLQIAAELGAHDVIQWSSFESASKDMLVSMATKDGRQKLAAVVDLIGSSSSSEAAVDALHHGGTLVTTGVGRGDVQIPIPHIISRSLGLCGVRAGGLRQLKQLVESIVNKNIYSHPPVEFCRLEKMNAAINSIRKGKVKGRAVVKFVL